ncbi:MAG TPA: hypothetical protein PLB81_08200 [Deltaproteobacteria bacterium]|nr:hypothetical protein [Deltaproteobacteria bacterium]
MSNLIKWVLIAVIGVILQCGCATDRLMKQEDFSLEQEKAKAVPIKPRPSAIAPAAPIEKPLRSPLDGKTITLTAYNAVFKDLYAAIAAKAGMDLVIDSRLTSALPARTADAPVPVDAKTAPAAVQAPAVQSAAVSSGQIELPPVSIAFNRTPLAQALDNLNNALHIFTQVNGNTLYVKGTETRTYHLNFLATHKQTSMSVGGDVLGGTSDTGGGSGASGGSSSGNQGPLSGAFSISSSIPTTTSDIYTQIDEVVKSVKTRHGTYSINRALGVLEINDMRPAIERIESYIKTIKAFYNSQVMITAKIIEVTLRDESKYGIDWTSIHTSIRGYDFNPIQQTLSLATDNLVPALQIAASSTEHGFDAALNALAEFGDIKVLSNPRIRVTNGQPALISVGTSTSYIQEIKLTTTTGDGDTQIITPEVTLGSIFDGIMLGVVPNIDLDKNAVNLSITPIKSKLVKIEERTIEKDVYSLPTVSLEEASTQIRVPSGDIIVLGGLISKNITTENKRVPIFGDIPYLGYLFRQETKGVETVELVVLLEPVIIAQ